MPELRPAAVAGMFYAEDTAQLRDQVRRYITGGECSPHTPKALIAPHAGYVYSGAVAGSAYASLVGLRDRVRRVVLLGPAHRVYVAGVAASSAGAFATPLGRVSLATETIRETVERFDFAGYNDEAHAPEHSLEVQLPFLQSVLADFELLPYAVGAADPSQIETLLEYLWGDADTLIVVSSDLSHYHDYATARALDQETSRRIAALDPTAITSDRACGQVPIRGLLRAARAHGLRCETIDLRNSGDTAGSRDRVVGYGAYLFYGAAV